MQFTLLRSIPISLSFLTMKLKPETVTWWSAAKYFRKKASGLNSEEETMISIYMNASENRWLPQQENKQNLSFVMHVNTAGLVRMLRFWLCVRGVCRRLCTCKDWKPKTNQKKKQLKAQIPCITMRQLCCWTLVQIWPEICIFEVQHTPNS